MKPKEILHSSTKKTKRKNKLRKPNSKILKGKTFFLDLIGYRDSEFLEKSIKLLGGTIEKCFSRDVKCLITNRGNQHDYERRTSRVGASSSCSQVPSPFNLASISLTSPAAENSPSQSESKSKVLTRGQAIARAANRTKSYGSTDCVECARQWKIKIIYCDAALNWVKKETKKYPSRGDSKSFKPSEDAKVTNLKGDYIKIENAGRAFRPLWCEFTNLPRLHFDKKHNQCPFVADRLSQPAQFDDRAERSFTDKETQHENKSKTRSTTKLILTAGEVKRKQKEKREALRNSGYCEICNQRYSNISQHVDSTAHRKLVEKTETFEKLDQFINVDINLQNFLLILDTTKTLSGKKINSETTSSTETTSNPLTICSDNLNETCKGSNFNDFQSMDNLKSISSHMLSPVPSCLNSASHELNISNKHFNETECKPESSLETVFSPPRRSLRKKQIDLNKRTSTPLKNGKTEIAKELFRNELVSSTPKSPQKMIKTKKNSLLKKVNESQEQVTKSVVTSVKNSNNTKVIPNNIKSTSKKTILDSKLSNLNNFESKIKYDENAISRRSPRIKKTDKQILIASEQSSCQSGSATITPQANEKDSVSPCFKLNDKNKSELNIAIYDFKPDTPLSVSFKKIVSLSHSLAAKDFELPSDIKSSPVYKEKIKKQFCEKVTKNSVSLNKENVPLFGFLPIKDTPLKSVSSKMSPVNSKSLDFNDSFESLSFDDSLRSPAYVLSQPCPDDCKLWKSPKQKIPNSRLSNNFLTYISPGKPSPKNVNISVSQSSLQDLTLDFLEDSGSTHYNNRLKTSNKKVKHSFIKSQLSPVLKPVLHVNPKNIKTNFTKEKNNPAFKWFSSKPSKKFKASMTVDRIERKNCKFYSDRGNSPKKIMLNSSSDTLSYNANAVKHTSKIAPHTNLNALKDRPKCRVRHSFTLASKQAHGIITSPLDKNGSSKSSSQYREFEWPSDY